MSTVFEVRHLTQEELIAELRERFGDNPLDWAFVCPHCQTISTGRDFRSALDSYGRTAEHASDFLGQQCIGRVIGALSVHNKKYEGVGCDWAAFGLFQGPWFVKTPDGVEIPSFPIATVLPSGVVEK